MILELFPSVDGHMTNLNTTMRAQGVAEVVQSVDGSNPEEFKEWIKSIETFGTLTGIPNERVIPSYLCQLYLRKDFIMSNKQCLSSVTMENVPIFLPFSSKQLGNFLKHGSTFRFSMLWPAYKD